MKHLAPACFRAFACAAGSCPDSCCRAGWEIVPDEETLNLYQTLPGEVGERIRAGIAPPKAFPLRGRWHRASPASPMTDEVAPRQSAAGSPDAEPLLRQDSERVCVLLDPDGLCCVQKHFGHGALCRVCRDYPRFHRDFGGLTEHGLSLSCPTAYALATAAPPAWEEWEDEALPVPNELDPAAYLRLRKGRTLALELLAREELPLRQRIALVRRLAAAMQGAPEHLIHHDYAPRLRRWRYTVGGGAHDAPRFTRSGAQCAPYAPRTRHTAAGDIRHDPWRTLCAAAGALARRFLSLEILSSAWKDALERFAAIAQTKQLPTDEPENPEVYARWLWYELYKYWLDALDDGQLLSRVDRALDMLLLGLAMDKALPGEGPFLRRLSREIEHCEENLAALLEP